MKLHREISITEGQGPVPLKLTLDEIIRDGKITNPYQTYAVALLSEFFKNGLKSASLQLETPLSFENGATKTEVVSSIKELSAEEQVSLAKYLKDCIDAGESAIKGHDLDVVAWMKFVLQKQD